MGCGRGELTRELLPHVTGGLVHGFDLDPRQVAAARSIAGARFEVADAEDLYEQPAGKYDLAVCRRLLLHVRRPSEVLRQMARIVRSGGAVAAIEPGVPDGLAGDVLDAIGERWLGRRLADLFAEAGLPDVTVARVEGSPPPLPTSPTDRDQYLGSGGTLERWEQHLAQLRPTEGLWGGIAKVP
ncbi:MAG: class I SAM-dependent methyltransferase [Proteobacteria bacterium]|nr:class I SAM-dependent methyltransferase [Pseudomonadota bacterium]